MKNYYGSVIDWIYSVAGGISPVEEAAGFEKIRIAPKPNKKMDWLKVSLDTTHGKVVSEWYYTDDGITMAPFVSGTLSIVDNGNNTATVNFDVVDDLGFKITGSWTGKMAPASELYTRSADLKQANKVATQSAKVSPKQTIEVKKRDISKF